MPSRVEVALVALLKAGQFQVAPEAGLRGGVVQRGELIQDIGDEAVPQLLVLVLLLLLLLLLLLRGGIVAAVAAAVDVHVGGVR